MSEKWDFKNIYGKIELALFYNLISMFLGLNFKLILNYFHGDRWNGLILMKSVNLIL